MIQVATIKTKVEEYTKKFDKSNFPLNIYVGLKSGGDSFYIN